MHSIMQAPLRTPTPHRSRSLSRGASESPSTSRAASREPSRSPRRSPSLPPRARTPRDQLKAVHSELLQELRQDLASPLPRRPAQAVEFIPIPINPSGYRGRTPPLAAPAASNPPTPSLHAPLQAKQLFAASAESVSKPKATD
ncbi:hypothetical protein HK100_002401 [Physocladia obscura]|uniref:Uncharacterized protein n=1 Tax=Physocladia obscura TaxID=109957 RepID=A0AAD5T7X6_9FUNG|nr:hypothetical protein HK100_002401 [Physocladia obscura]